MSAGWDIRWRRWGLGFDVIFESYFKAGWVTVGPLVLWVEL